MNNEAISITFCDCKLFAMRETAFANQLLQSTLFVTVSFNFDSSERIDFFIFRYLYGNLYIVDEEKAIVENWNKYWIIEWKMHQ